MSSKIPLNKNIYEAKQARDVLDEEFFEFLPLKRNIKEFFDIYNKKFFSILRDTHLFFIDHSLDYIKEWTNPKTIEIANINKEIENINFEILSEEKHHPIFPNRIIVTTSAQNSPFLNINPMDFPLYYIQSATARPILGEQKENIYNTIKTQQRSRNAPDSRFIVQIHPNIYNSLKKGKPIEKEEDLNDSFYTLNIYNG
tara:strand:- start:86 stop:682 length:597 start_codon:yes stop_codon:yes gene_type:complete